jgi:hypothetical protein
VSWQLLVVALKLKRGRPFLLAGLPEADVGAKVPGEVDKHLGSQIPPTMESSNLRHKVLHAFHHAHKHLERGVVDQILDNPEKLGHNSFIDSISNRSSIVRSKVTDCIL